MDHAAHADHGHAHDEHRHDGHGHAAPAADPHGGQIPAVPAARSITPAPEDFIGLPGASGLAWPLFWIAVGVVGAAVLLGGGWRAFTSDHGAASDAAGH